MLHPSRSVGSAREWLAHIRLTGFTAIMLTLVVVGALVVLPTAGTLIRQRQQVVALQAEVALGQEELAELQAQQERWSDPSFIVAQARERLFYVHPGEVVYLIVNDLPVEREPHGQQPVSDEVERTRTNWMNQLVRSVTEAGISTSVVSDGVSETGTTNP